ncbi:hypothetical protein NE865_10383 [Phthorimaea operculella]|nr:hypothetical protein NE865_10383 [Phthorimaea operculella]
MEVGEDDTNVVSTNTPDEMAAVSDNPIMVLFKRLIGNENKQNTVLTNTQIIDLLEKEFDMNTEDLHELELEIYLSTTKKFLKDWPQWDEFDTAINIMKQRNIPAETDKMLLRKYRQLKNYLLTILDTVTPIAKEKVLDVEKKFSNIQEDLQKKEALQEEDLSDLVLEIQCTRPQLNSLILRHPHPEQNYTIFNTLDSGPSKIFLDSLCYEAMLNWWDIEICFKMPDIQFVRSTVHGMKHTLMNKNLPIKNKACKLHSGHLEKPAIPGKIPDLNILKKKQFAEVLRKLYSAIKDHRTHFLSAIFYTLQKDLAGLPNDLQEGMSYRKYFSKYAYMRDLCTDVPEGKNDKEAMNYDLVLREQISPMYQLDIFKVEQWNIPGAAFDLQSVYVRCKSCLYKFSGIKMLEQLRQHILDHLHEPDWQCMKCKESFTMVQLARDRWLHDCKGIVQKIPKEKITEF